MTENGQLYGAFTSRGLRCLELGWPCVNVAGLSFALLITGLIGLGGLALVMGTALSSLAELLASPANRPLGW